MPVEKTLQERDIVAYMKTLCKRHGITCRKVRWESTVGAPDWLLLGLGHHVFVECKAPGKSPTVKQCHELQRLLRAGLKTFVATRLIDADAVVAQFLK